MYRISTDRERRRALATVYRDIRSSRRLIGSYHRIILIFHVVVEIDARPACSDVGHGRDIETVVDVRLPGRIYVGPRRRQPLRVMEGVRVNIFHIIGYKTA